jgi:hypothetical protein
MVSQGWFKDQPEKAKPHFDDWKAKEELTDQVTCQSVTF